MAEISLNSSSENLKLIFEKYGKELNDLTESKKYEESKEPKKPDLPLIQTFLYYKDMPEERKMLNYIDRPFIISKIDAPFRKFSQDIIQDLLYTEKYPEKFSLKACIDLRNARDFFKKISCNSDVIVKTGQDEIILFYLYLYGMDIEDSSAGAELNFARNLEIYESNQIISKMTTGKKRNYGKMELSKDFLKKIWILNLIEGINEKIKQSYSTTLNDHNKAESINFHERRRINVKTKKSGSSEIFIEVILDDDIKGSISIFSSSTISLICYENKVIFGNGDYLNYFMTLADHNMNLSLIKELIIKDNEENILKRERIQSSRNLPDWRKTRRLNKINATISECMNEIKFIDYIYSLLGLETEKRVGMASLYETTCLMMADFKFKSSILPLLDNLQDSIKIDENKTEELVSICLKSSSLTCVKMSCIGKTLIYAEIDEKKGLEKYTQRTNRNHKVDGSLVNKLRLQFRMKVITNFINKYGIVPNIKCNNKLLLQELNLMASRGSYSRKVVENCNNYATTKLGKMLEVGQEKNITSRIIDKACTKDNYSPDGNSVKELIYYIKNNNLDDIINEIDIDEINLENINEENRDYAILQRKDCELINIPKYKVVRLVEKEKELKESARFFGVASFKLKIYISVIMELVKRAMKLIPGQMMTMTEDERRQIMYKMTKLLKEDDAYAIFLDYSGHNTSQRPANTKFILEEICDMYGFSDESQEKKHVLDVVYLFYNIHCISENSMNDFVYYSQRQFGAIEGWFGPLWGIQSQLMMDDMLETMGFTDFLGTTYSDDSCGVFKEKDLTEGKLNDIIRHIQDYASRMGLIVKLSQTQVTNGRCSMLKNHYIKGLSVESNYKRIMGISPNSASNWSDELELMRNIDSGYTSSTSRADKFNMQTVIRNFRVVRQIKTEIVRFARSYEIELDERFLTKENSEIMMAKLLLKSSAYASKYNVLNIPDLDALYQDFFHFNAANEEVLCSTLLLMYLPLASYGYSQTPMVDANISGYSVSNIKRLMYCDSLCNNNNLRRIVYCNVEINTNAFSLINNPFPIKGGRYDTGTLLTDVLKNELMKHIENKDLILMKEAVTRVDEESFKTELIDTFRNCFSSRIVSKYYECSIFSYFEEIYSKIDNSTTFNFIVGKKKLGRLWNKAWMINHKLDYSMRINNNLGINSYGKLIELRNNTVYKLRFNDKEHDFKVKFLSIEEIPLLGKIEKRKYNSCIKVIRKDNEDIEDDEDKLIKPTKTNINVAKFDRDIEIEGMFQNKLIFLAYELVRYTKWIIMDMEKFSKCNHNIIKSLIKITNCSLSTFTDARFEDLSESVVSPVGGRYFHRALASGFNPKTGDLSSNKWTSKYEVGGIDKLIESTGGQDNNLNIQYLILIIKTSLSLIEADNNILCPLGLTDDIIQSLRDVSFELDDIKPAELIHIYKNNVSDLSTLKSKSSLYRSFSNFISTDENIRGKFINHKDFIPDEIIEKYSSFMTLNKYMKDQMIISPNLIPLDTLMKIAKEIKSKEEVEGYLKEYYRYYTGLNLIENETPTKSVLRSIMFNEIFNKEKDNWIDGMVKYGMSQKYRMELMKVFIIATSLSYSLSESGNQFFKVEIEKNRTLSNTILNLRRLRQGNYDFYMTDIRIVEIINYAFPIIGYRTNDCERAVEQLMTDYNNIEIEKCKVNIYYRSEQKNYIEDPKEIIEKVIPIEYNTFTITKKEFENVDPMRASIGIYSTVSTMHCKPDKVSSPTMSDVFPSALGLMSTLMRSGFITNKEEVIEYFSGRGDFHIAMSKLGIKHTSLSRNDGYNLINRAKGMIELKDSIDLTLSEEYTKYIDRDIALIDLSYFKGSQIKLMEMINDLIKLIGKVIIRVNSIIEPISQAIINSKNELDIKLHLPDIDSPGYIYLTIEKLISVEDETYEFTAEKLYKGQEGKSFFTSFISETMVKAIYKRKELFYKDFVESNDHTRELISDETIIDLLEDIEQSGSMKYQVLEELHKPFSSGNLEKKELVLPVIPTILSKNEKDFINRMIMSGKITVISMNLHKDAMDSEGKGLREFDEMNDFIARLIIEKIEKKKELEKLQRKEKEIKSDEVLSEDFPEISIDDIMKEINNLVLSEKYCLRLANIMERDYISSNEKDVKLEEYEIILRKNRIKFNGLLLITEIRPIGVKELNRLVEIIRKTGYENKKLNKIMRECNRESKIRDSNGTENYVVDIVKKYNEVNYVDHWDENNPFKTRIFTTLRIAIEAMRLGKIYEGLKIISGIDKWDIKTVNANKSKNIRTDILNYKLFINRLIEISIKTKRILIKIRKEEYGKSQSDLTSNFKRFIDEIKEINKERINPGIDKKGKNINDDGIGYDNNTLSDYLSDEEIEDIENYDKKIYDFINQFETIEDYFKDANTIKRNEENDNFFMGLIDSLKHGIQDNIMEVNKDVEKILLKFNSGNERDTTKISNSIANTLSNLMNTDEETEKANREIDLNEVLEEIGDEYFEEYDVYD